MLEPPPTELNDPAVAGAVADGWRFLVQTVEYMPVGAGGYHWNVTDSTGRSLLVTADDLDTKDWLGDDRNAIAQGLIAALDTALAVSSGSGPTVLVSFGPTLVPGKRTVQSSRRVRERRVRLVRCR